jgi:hypothetical protein
VSDAIPFPEGRYRSPQIPISDWPHGEHDRPGNYPIYEEREHFLATVHGFDAGGFEATIRCLDVQALVDARMRPRGYRKPVAERSERDVLRAVARAKKMLRHGVKRLGCDHLLTLTTREAENTPESLAQKWKAFVRRYRDYSKDEFPYVSIPERHPSNPKHWHLHVAIRGRLKLKIARQIWWAVCGGRGLGNVDVRYIKVGVNPVTGAPKGPLVRAEKIARYISRYMTKDPIFAHRPDKKRYWRSEFDLPEVRRYWLKTRPSQGADSLHLALQEFPDRFGLTGGEGLSLFVFPDGSGVWINFNPDASLAKSTHPPPF